MFSVAFPSACSICQQELADLSWTGVCSQCWEALEPWRGPVCPRCGIPLASAHATDAAELICAECRNPETSFDQARNSAIYGDKMRAAVLILKYQHRPRWGTKLGALLAPLCADLLASFDACSVLVIPVPLHAGRLRERGYNQAELLSLGLVRAAAAAIPRAELELDEGVLIKIRAARRENVRGAFAVARPERIRDRVVILVDDVMTTGETLSACALALKSAGAKAVLAVTLARATPQFPDTHTLHGGV